MGNSATRLYKQLQEQHSEQRLKQVARYLTECESFVAMPGLQITAFQQPPKACASAKQCEYTFCEHFILKVGWLVGLWCTHFRDLAPLINSTPLINSVPFSIMCKIEGIIFN